MKETLKRRLAAVEARALPDIGYCMVELPDGTESEVTMEEWYEHRHEWRWMRMTRGSDPDEMYLLFAAWDEECGLLESAKQNEEMYFRKHKRRERC